MTLTIEFIEQSLIRLNENTPRIEKCLAQLSEEQVWQRPNNTSNSIGHLILHLSGNITQYIISSLGGAEDLRIRDKEFSAIGELNKSELMLKLNQTVSQASRVIQSMDEVTLLQIRSVQGFQFSGIANIIHVVEHYSYHTGQIAFWTKVLTGLDLGFYAGQDLNQKNQL